MMLAPRTLSTGELALRITARPGRGGWFVLLVSDGQSALTADALKQELSALGVEQVCLVNGPSGAGELARLAQAESSAVLIVSGLEKSWEDEWKHMDLLRSQFEREAGVVLILEKAVSEHLQRQAPNLMSWIGSSIWTFVPDADSLTPDEREARLQALRKLLSVTDQQVLDLAKRERLPPDPAYAEWLVLLNRGDLLGF